MAVNQDKSALFVGNVSLIVRDANTDLVSWREGEFDYNVQREAFTNKPLIVTATGRGRFVTKFRYDSNGNFIGTDGDPLHTSFLFELMLTT